MSAEGRRAGPCPPRRSVLDLAGVTMDVVAGQQTLRLAVPRECVPLADQHRVFRFGAEPGGFIPCATRRKLRIASCAITRLLCVEPQCRGHSDPFSIGLDINPFPRTPTKNRRHDGSNCDNSRSGRGRGHVHTFPAYPRSVCVKPRGMNPRSFFALVQSATLSWVAISAWPSSNGSSPPRPMEVATLAAIAACSPGTNHVPIFLLVPGTTSRTVSLSERQSSTSEP